MKEDKMIINDTAKKITGHVEMIVIDGYDGTIIVSGFKTKDIEDRIEDKVPVLSGTASGGFKYVRITSIEDNEIKGEDVE